MSHQSTLPGRPRFALPISSATLVVLLGSHAAADLASEPAAPGVSHDVSDVEHAPVPSPPHELSAPTQTAREPQVEPRQKRVPEWLSNVTAGGWIEAYYAWSANEPSNGIIDLRGFDNRHDTVNISNAVLDLAANWRRVHARLALQWGSTPVTYYLAEPEGPSAGTGIGPQGASHWRTLQEANFGYRIPLGAGLDVSAGLFLSPIGVESLAVKDNWLYSRTNLFYGYPFYHTGIRAWYPVTEAMAISAWVVNGWNSVLDNNSEKTFILQSVFSSGGVFQGSAAYVGGVERPRGAPAGRAWRHLFDINGTLTASPWLAFQGQATGGFEPNAFGTSAFFGGLLATKVSPVEWLALVLRGDYFWETTSNDASGAAEAIFWPVEWIGSVTTGLRFTPQDHLAVHLEYRRDWAAGDAFFEGQPVGDGLTTPYIRNADTQDTVTLGATAWF